jgi:hypothetical protein
MLFNMKILIEFNLDGYETEEEMRKACIEFIKYQLDMSASSVKILWAEGENKNE